MAIDLVVIGSSLGGLHALGVLLGGLPGSFSLPVAIVQHRGKETGDGLRHQLQKTCLLDIEEVEDKAPITGGKIYLAPADYHLLVDGRNFALSIEGPVDYSRPSIDVFFESAAFYFGPRLVGVILTGSNKDGAFGVTKIKEEGGTVVVQDPVTAESPIMPRAANAAVTPDYILPLDQIAGFLSRLC